ncbi:MAG: hypothetical protein IJU75_06225 [Clostridia bacterium]|nr:hypothetical protein [Clostridia bacterium]
MKGFILLNSSTPEKSVDGNGAPQRGIFNTVDGQTGDILVSGIYVYGNGKYLGIWDGYQP